MTQQQALNWINGGWRKSKYKRGRGIDVDGFYGFQCMDLVMAYTLWLNNWRPYGNAKALATQPIPRGWRRIKNTPSFVPQAGDVAIWNRGSFARYGHTGLVKSANARTFKSLDQNWFNANSVNGSPPRVVSHNYNGFYGVIRPEFEKVKKTRRKKMVNKGDLTNMYRALLGRNPDNTALKRFVGMDWGKVFYLIIHSKEWAAQRKQEADQDKQRAKYHKQLVDTRQQLEALQNKLKNATKSANDLEHLRQKNQKLADEIAVLTDNLEEAERKLKQLNQPAEPTPSQDLIQENNSLLKQLVCWVKWIVEKIKSIFK